LSLGKADGRTAPAGDGFTARRTWCRLQENAEANAIVIEKVGNDPAQAGTMRTAASHPTVSFPYFS
jgi:hypothetical protein